MDIEEIYKTIDEWSVNFKQPARQFKNYPEFKAEVFKTLKELYNINEDDFKGCQRAGPQAELYWFLKHRRTSFPICPITGNRTSFKDTEEYCKYYKDTAPKDTKYINNRKENLINKYGTNCALLTDVAIEKSKQTCMNRYGVQHHMSNPSIYQKAKDTWDKKYGGHYMLSEDVIKKRKQTCMDRYGSPSYLSSDENQNKATIVKRTKSFHNLIRFQGDVEPRFTLEEWLEQRET